MAKSSLWTKTIQLRRYFFSKTQKTTDFALFPQYLLLLSQEHEKCTVANGDLIWGEFQIYASCLDR
jgi:hypothetical protein